MKDQMAQQRPTSSMPAWCVNGLRDENSGCSLAAHVHLHHHSHRYAICGATVGSLTLSLIFLLTVPRNGRNAGFKVRPLSLAAKRLFGQLAQKGEDSGEGDADVGNQSKDCWQCGSRRMEESAQKGKKVNRMREDPAGPQRSKSGLLRLYRRNVLSLP